MKYYKPTQHSVLHSMYCMIYACAYVYGKVIFDGLDWFGKKLVDLIDHSDFFCRMCNHRCRNQYLGIVDKIKDRWCGNTNGLKSGMLSIFRFYYNTG